MMQEIQREEKQPVPGSPSHGKTVHSAGTQIAPNQMGHSAFNCQYNADAIMHLQRALDAMRDRTNERESRKVEGTHTA